MDADIVGMKLSLQSQPIAYQKACEAIIYLLIGFSIVHWSDTQIVLVLAVVSSILGLFVWNSVTPNVKVQEQVDAKEAQIHNFLSDMQNAAPDKVEEGGD